MQSALLTVRKQLATKKRALCRLCRDEEGLDSAMQAAQAEFDEVLLQLQDRRESLALLRTEQKCAWCVCACLAHVHVLCVPTEYHICLFPLSTICRALE